MVDRAHRLQASTTDRTSLLDRLRSRERWDIAIVGGGATGLGAAVDAVSRGYRTVLVESNDFGQGTSSRSTKLIHGGVRYLAQGNVGLVREALRERSTLMRNAPHLVGSRSFLLPTHRRLSIPYYLAGLTIYDALAGGHGLGKSRAVSAIEAKRLVPTLREARLRGGIVYRDGQFDDSRLIIALLRTFADLGGVALNYLPAIEFRKESSRISGLMARDAETGEEFRIEARAVINAAGVFADEIRTLDRSDAPAMIRPSRGIHLVLPRRVLPGETALLIPKTDDGRVLFSIPWHDRVLLGTTDTPMSGSPPREPRASHDEVAYLLDHATRFLDPAPEAGDILSSFAGLRPLIGHSSGGTTAQLSREYVVEISTSGLITITGGKWTTYRPMGSHVIDEAAKIGGLEPRRSTTGSQRLRGSPNEGQDRIGTIVGDEASPDPLVAYGTDAEQLRLRMVARPDEAMLLHPRLPYYSAEVIWAVDQEWARTVEDVLSRRTRALLLDAQASIEAAPRVAALMSESLGRDESWRSDQVSRFRTLARAYLNPGDLEE